MAVKDLDRFVNLDSVADGFFRDAVVDHVSVYCEVFDERLASVYVWGSVHRNEAVLEVSDLDLHPFVLDAVTDADRIRLRESEASLRKEFLSLMGLSHKELPRKLSEDVRRFYDDLAADYHHVYAEWESAIERQSCVLDRLIQRESSADASLVLDCSCGIGTQAIGLARQGIRSLRVRSKPEGDCKGEVRSSRPGV